MLLGDVLQANRYKTNGFDYLRLVLAAGVIIFHGYTVTHGKDQLQALQHPVWKLVVGPILPLFFALSGFLVYGSLMRCTSLISFLGYRVLRIFPALVCEVVLSALILGPVFTVLPLQEYFGSSTFYNYFLNLIGWIHYELPGVFLDNPQPGRINGQLWTIPYELHCYILLSLLTVTGLALRRHYFLVAIVAMQVALVAVVLASPAKDHTGKMLLLAFCFGALIRAQADVIKLSGWYFLVSLALMGVALLVPAAQWLLPAPAAYAAAYVGVTQPRKPGFLFSGDYSYGMYLYGYPIQQMLVVLLPAAAWYSNAALALVLAFAVAHLSWYLVEKPTLALKPRVDRLEGNMLAKMPAWFSALWMCRRPQAT